MYSANGYFINNQSIIENFKNNKKKKSRIKPVPNVLYVEFSIVFQNDKSVTSTEIFGVPINSVPDSIDMFDLENDINKDINKIKEINISFNIKNDSNNRKIVVKTSKEAEVTFNYGYFVNNINYKHSERIKNIDSKVKRFNYLIQIPTSSSNIITKCKITIKPDIDSNVIIMNNLKTAINDILV
jgi:hypothetical protein